MMALRLEYSLAPVVPALVLYNLGDIDSLTAGVACSLYCVAFISLVDFVKMRYQSLSKKKEHEIHKKDMKHIYLAPEEFYDVVLDYKVSFSDLAVTADGAEKGWRLVVNSQLLRSPTATTVSATTSEDVKNIMVDWKGQMVAVFGEFNRGKTWLLGCLTSEDFKFPTGNNLSTPGICAKAITVDADKKMRLVVVDTQGQNAPVWGCNRETVNRSTLEELFFRHVVGHMCKNFLFVVNKITKREQVEMIELCHQLKGSAKRLFVVHNWRDVETEEDFQSHIEETMCVCNAIDEDDCPRVMGTKFCYRRKHDTEEREGRISRNDGVHIFVDWIVEDAGAPRCFEITLWAEEVKGGRIRHVPHAVLRFAKRAIGSDLVSLSGEVEGVEQEHFFLGKEGTNGGKRNRETILQLRNALIYGGAKGGDATMDFGRFNYLKDLHEALQSEVPKVFRSANSEQMKVITEFRPAKEKPGAFQVFVKLDESTGGSQMSSPGGPSRKPPSLEIVDTPQAFGQPSVVLSTGVTQGTGAPPTEVPHTFLQCTEMQPKQEGKKQTKVIKQRWVLQVPGFAKVSEEDIPNNDNIVIDGMTRTMTVKLTRDKLKDSDDWHMCKGPNGSKTQYSSEYTLYDDVEFNYDLGDFTANHIIVKQDTGLLEITVVSLPQVVK